MDRVGGGDVEGGIGNLMLKASVYFAALDASELQAQSWLGTDVPRYHVYFLYSSTSISGLATFPGNR